MPIRSYSMLERTSRFVLEILPCVLSALIAAVVVLGFLYSQIHETKAAVAAHGPRLEIINWHHAVLSPDRDRRAEDRLAYR
jgi:hypothetical protein